MIITLLSYKGGVGKTTISIQLASYLTTVASGYESLAVVDGDPNQAAIDCGKRGNLPFPVFNTAAHASIRKYEHLIIDSEARPKPENVEALAECDLLLLPTIPEASAAIVTVKTIQTLEDLGCSNYAVVLSMVPPPPRKTAQQMREQFNKDGYPVLKSELRRYAVYEKASLHGIPVNQVKGDKNAGIAWRDICALGEEVLSYVN